MGVNMHASVCPSHLMSGHYLKSICCPFQPWYTDSLICHGEDTCWFPTAILNFKVSFVSKVDLRSTMNNSAMNSAILDLKTRSSVGGGGEGRTDSVFGSYLKFQSLWRARKSHDCLLFLHGTQHSRVPSNIRRIFVFKVPVFYQWMSRWVYKRKRVIVSFEKKKKPELVSSIKWHDSMAYCHLILYFYSCSGHFKNSVNEDDAKFDK